MVAALAAVAEGASEDAGDAAAAVDIGAAGADGAARCSWPEHPVTTEMASSESRSRRTDKSYTSQRALVNACAVRESVRTLSVSMG